LACGVVASGNHLQIESEDVVTRPAASRWLIGLAIGVGVLSALGNAAIARQRATSAAMVASAAKDWLASLTPEQRQQATFALDSEELVHWNFIPTAMFPRKGLPIKAMTPPQREKAHALLKAGLSQLGYTTATSIMDLENVLREVEAGTPNAAMRDQELYFFTVFGTPSAQGAWAWRAEGHHISLHFFVDNGKLTLTTAPAFFGSNPAEVRDGPKKGLRVLGAEEDAARSLLGALDPGQRTTAIVTATAPGDIVTGTKLKIDPLTPAGLPAAQMTPNQRTLLMQIIEVYTSLMSSETAADRMTKIRAAGTDTIAFAWAGETEKGKKHYYRVQGPTFLIEYDNTQNDGNHVHSVWRDFNGDFGRDLLREHLALWPHP
jgi:hypothetical protein